MIFLLKRVRAFLRGVYKPIKYNFDYYSLRNKVSNDSNIKIIDNVRSLILIPHADDEWVGCSQLIVNNPKNIILCSMNMLGGDSEELHIKRFQELRSIADNYKLPLVTMGKEHNEKVENLFKLITEKQLEYILVPFYYDWHADHVEVMRILREVLVKMRIEKSGYINTLKILMYQISVPIPLKRITHCMPMNKREHKQKWSIFYKVYKTQLTIPWIRFKYNERINGGLYNSYAAEVYSCVDPIVWVDYLEKEIFDKNESILVVKDLQDLKKIRSIITKIRG